MKKTMQSKILHLYDGNNRRFSFSQDRSYQNSIKSASLSNFHSKNNRNKQNSQCITDRSDKINPIHDFSMNVSPNLQKSASLDDLNNPKSFSNNFNMKTYVRFRPFTINQMKSEECTPIDNITFVDSKCLRINRKDHHFDEIFTPESDDQKVYENSSKKLISNFLKGFNATIFTYGQTGSGKTFTMFGNGPHRKGIIPRAIQDIWKLKQAQSKTDLQLESISNFDNLPQRKIKLSCSMIEIYRENIYDLLNQHDTEQQHLQHLKIKQGPSGFEVSKLTIKQVETIQDVMKLIEKGNQSKKVRQTKLNETSSRSHVIFTIYLEVQVNKDSFRKSKLNLIDLAGSQKVSKSKVDGEGLQQAKKINLSLSVLGNTISALSKGQDHIPYRQSKLTKLLHQSLGGNSLTSLIVTCSMNENCSQQTLSSLKFASRARKIKNTPTQNIVQITDKERFVDKYLFESLKQSFEQKQSLLSEIRKSIKDYDEMQESMKIQYSQYTIEKIRDMIDFPETAFKKTQKKCHFPVVESQSHSDFSTSKKQYQNINNSDTFSSFEAFNIKILDDRQKMNSVERKQSKQSSDRIKLKISKVKKPNQSLLSDVIKRQQQRISKLEKMIQQQNQKINSFNHPLEGSRRNPGKLRNLKLKINNKNIQEPLNNRLKQVEMNNYKQQNSQLSKLQIQLRKLVNCIEIDKKQFYNFERQVLKAQISELLLKVQKSQKPQSNLKDVSEKFLENYIEFLESSIQKCYAFLESFFNYEKQTCEYSFRKLRGQFNIFGPFNQKQNERTPTFISVNPNINILVAKNLELLIQQNGYLKEKVLFFEVYFQQFLEVQKARIMYLLKMKKKKKAQIPK